MRSRAARSPEIVALAGASVAAFALILSVGAGLSFFNDEWEVILTRPGWSADSLLGPHNEHIYVGVVVIYKLLLAGFGMDSTLPFRIVNTALVVTVAVLVFAYMRPRVGGWPAVLAAVVLLFMGPSWENLLWPAGISFMGALAAGLGALLMLDRESRRGDFAACALLVVSVSFSTLGLFFAAAIALDLVLRRKRRELRRAYVALIPVALYGLWYLGYGAAAPEAASAGNLDGLPAYLLDSFRSVVSSLLGLGLPGSDSATVELARSVLIACAVILAIALGRRSGAPGRRFWVLVIIAVGFWASAGINEIPGREPQASRYQLIGAVFVFLALSELLRRQRFASVWRWTLAAATVAIVASNLGPLRDGERFLRAHSEVATADLAALEIARGQVDRGFRLEPEIAETPFLETFSAAQYFDGIARWGSPADSEAELSGATETARTTADSVLVAALQIGLQPAEGNPRRGGDQCLDLGLRPGDPEVLSSPGGRIRFGPLEGTTARVLVRRYAQDGFSAALGSLQAKRSTDLRLPAAGLSRPWQVGVQGKGAVVVCRISAAAR